MPKALVGFHLPEGALRGHIMHGRQLSYPPYACSMCSSKQKDVFGQKKEHQRMCGDGNSGREVSREYGGIRACLLLVGGACRSAVGLPIIGSVCKCVFSLYVYV